MDETWYSNSWLLAKLGIFSTKKNRAMLKALSASFLVSAFGLDLDCLDDKYKKALLDQLGLNLDSISTSGVLFSQGLASLEQRQEVKTRTISREVVAKIRLNELPYFLR
mmetsp:Transcript_2961/g.3747  ORF Transcript_2961/g.3747 Transcript_2961/m.3747 type:complete len:109 (+) Transcript_2961:914-1240(+)